MRDLQEQHGISYLFISHDLNMVRYISHRMVVMYLGAVMEEGPALDLYEFPQHPYTRALTALNGPVMPHAPIGAPLKGDPPNPLAPSKGCLFSGSMSRSGRSLFYRTSATSRLGRSPHRMLAHIMGE